VARGGEAGAEEDGSRMAKPSPGRGGSKPVGRTALAFGGAPQASGEGNYPAVHAEPAVTSTVPVSLRLVPPQIP
jgi:hypothetical protein